MDSNTTNENSSSANPGRNAADKSGSFQGNRSNYNKKKKQRHFGPVSNTQSAAVSPSSGQQSASQGNAVLRPPKHPNQNQQGGNVQRNTAAQQKTSSQTPQQPQPIRTQHPNATGGSNNPPASRNFNPQQPVQQRQQHHQQQQSPQSAQAIMPNQQQKPNQQPRKWETRAIKIEETFEDIKKDNERIEKEIWLEIAEIHNTKLD